MIGHRAVIGLSLFSALLFSAFAAQSASALVVTQSKNTTGFTCVKGGGSKDFKDAHCDEAVTPGTGEYGHVVIPLNEKPEGDGTNEKVTESTKKSEPAVLKGTIGLAKVTIECTTGSPKTSAAQNTEPAAGQHTAGGSGAAEFSGCTVKELAKCVVAEPIVAGAIGHGVEGMEGPKGEKNAMGIELVGSGAEETFTTIEFKNKGAEACSLNGKSFPIKGRVVATNGPTTESKQDNKHTGSTVIFTPKFKMQTLKLGPNTASVEAIGTVTVKGGNPIAMTTTT
ncbi:MAG: hypothetical protein WBL45_12355 [Solirubrobacterales bacterium]